MRRIYHIYTLCNFHVQNVYTRSMVWAFKCIWCVKTEYICDIQSLDIAFWHVLFFEVFEVSREGGFEDFLIGTEAGWGWHPTERQFDCNRRRRRPASQDDAGCEYPMSCSGSVWIDCVWDWDVDLFQRLREDGAGENEGDQPTPETKKPVKPKPTSGKGKSNKPVKPKPTVGKKTRKKKKSKQ